MRLALLLTLASIPSLFAVEDPAAHDSAAGHRHHGHPAETSGSAHHPHLDLEEDDEAFFHLHPHLSAVVAFGGSTSEKNLTLIRGGHAPIDDGINVQGIELGAVMEFGHALSLHTAYHAFWDRREHWDGELEETYAAFSLPGGVALRAGRFLAPFGYENTLHLHDRPFVEPPVSLVRLVGEHGLVAQGADIAFALPGPGEETILRFGYGKSHILSHDGHHHGAAETHEDHEDETHHEDEEHDDHDDGHAGEHGVYDAHRSYLDEGYVFARLATDLPGLPGPDRAGLSFAAGENGFGRTTWLVGLDLDGAFSLADRPAWWRSEIYHRSVRAIDAAGVPGEFDETGIYASLGCEFVEDWTAAARLEWASGNRMVGHERRWRASANVDHVTRLASRADLHTRLQYSLDDVGGHGTEHSVWLQFVLNLGAAEHGHRH